jgi:ferrochelatase
MRLGIVLFNLGGPDSLDAVEPFLRNLFSDPAIISLPAFVRQPLARFIAWRRAPIARKIYAHMGGRSPILDETQVQARALEAELQAPDLKVKTVVAMRYWHPFSHAAAEALRRFEPERIILLPLYPQFSTTTTASSFKDWNHAAQRAGLSVPTGQVCCYPMAGGFVAAAVSSLRAAMGNPKPGVRYRLLLSAHGLPQRVVEKGDPYQWQVEQTAQAIVDGLGITELDWEICYQSRVGPMKWLEPATDAAIRRAGAEAKGVVVIPIAFVSEHSETLVELDIEYARLAGEVGVPDYRRAKTVSADGDFIKGLAGLVRKALASGASISGGSGRICPAQFGRCGYRGRE